MNLVPNKQVLKMGTLQVWQGMAHYAIRDCIQVFQPTNNYAIFVFIWFPEMIGIYHTYVIHTAKHVVAA